MLLEGTYENVRGAGSHKMNTTLCGPSVLCVAKHLQHF